MIATYLLMAGGNSFYFYCNNSVPVPEWQTVGLNALKVRDPDLSDYKTSYEALLTQALNCLWI